MNATSHTNAELEAIGRQDAEVWIRYARRRHARALADGDSLADLKRELDQVGGWWGMLREDYPRFVAQSAVLSDPDCTQRERLAWSVGFERRAIEIVRGY